MKTARPKHGGKSVSKRADFIACAGISVRFIKFLDSNALRESMFEHMPSTAGDAATDCCHAFCLAKLAA
jgi:hypothetical protein